jgi:ABC-2 type transport system permease protein
MMTWNAIWVIARAQFLITRNTFWRGKIGQKVGLVVLLSFLGFAAWGLYNFSSFIVRTIRNPDFAEFLREAAEQAQQSGTTLPTDIMTFLLAVPSFTLFLALVFLVFSSFSSVLSSLYLSGDMDMLLVAPVPIRAVFTVKFFGGLLIQYLLLFALAGPVLLGYGNGMQYGAFYYIATLLTLALMPLLPAGLGALLVMAVVRVIPARRAREIVSVIGGLIGVLFYIITQFTREVGSAVADVRNLNTLLNVNMPALPSSWAGRALLAAGEGQPLTFLVYGGLFAILSIAVFAGCLLLSERLYYAGWSNMSTQGGRIKRRTPNDEQRTTGPAKRPTPILAWFSTLLPRQSRAVFYKDWRLFPRDLRNLQQLIFPLALAGIWTFRLFTTPSQPLDPDVPDFVNQMTTLGGAGIAFFLCLTLSSAIAGTGISREGKAFWILKLAPISPLRILLGKLALAYLPYPTVGALFLLITALVGGIGLGDFLFQLALLLLVGLGSTCVSLGLGAAFPKLDWENPQQQTTFRASCLGMLFYPVYIMLVLAAALGLPALGSVLSLSNGLAIMLTTLGWAIAAGLTALAVWGGLSLGARGLGRIEV